jgi:hypothetical protein
METIDAGMKGMKGNNIEMIDTGMKGMKDNNVEMIDAGMKGMKDNNTEMIDTGMKGMKDNNIEIIDTGTKGVKEHGTKENPLKVSEIGLLIGFHKVLRNISVARATRQERLLQRRIELKKIKE